jgi:hypothetical protein
MAARLNPRHSEMVRAKIQASQLINRLTSHALGDAEMSATQVQAAKILLDKTLSNAPTVNEISGPDGGPVNTSLTVEFVKAAVEREVPGEA